MENTPLNVAHPIPNTPEQSSKPQKAEEASRGKTSVKELRKMHEDAITKAGVPTISSSASTMSKDHVRAMVEKFEPTAADDKAAKAAKTAEKLMEMSKTTLYETIFQEQAKGTSIFDLASLVALCESGILPEEESRNIMLRNLQTFIEDDELIYKIAQLSIKDMRDVHRQLCIVNKKLTRRCQSIENQQELVSCAIQCKHIKLLKFLFESHFVSGELIYTLARNNYTQHSFKNEKHPDKITALDTLYAVIGLLLRSGFNIDCKIFSSDQSDRNKNPQTMLEWAIEDHNINLAIKLINTGAEYTPQLVQQTFFKAVRLGSPLSEIQSLIDLRADITAKDKDDLTALERESAEIYLLFSDMKIINENYVERQNVAQELIHVLTMKKIDLKAMIGEDLMAVMILCLVPESEKVIDELISNSPQQATAQNLKAILLRPIYTQEERNRQIQIIKILMKGGAKLAPEDYAELDKNIDEISRNNIIYKDHINMTKELIRRIKNGEKI